MRNIQLVSVTILSIRHAFGFTRSTILLGDNIVGFSITTCCNSFPPYPVLDSLDLDLISQIGKFCHPQWPVSWVLFV